MSLDAGQERLARQASSRGLPIREVARAIGASEADVRETLTGVRVEKVAAEPKPKPKPIEPEFAEGSASSWAPKLAVIPHRLTCLAISRIVARYYMIPDAAMQSQRRMQSIARPRQVAFYLCREMTAASYPEIGRRFGGRDHTTVMHGHKMTAIRMETDKKLRADIEAITTTIRNQYSTHDSAVEAHSQAGEGI